jgi:hypothetical protein
VVESLWTQIGDGGGGGGGGYQLYNVERGSNAMEACISHVISV